jgi:hypothetical protein
MPPLFSGNGRHRRPRQAPSFVVTAGVTGAGIALPLLGATGANAAEASTWDKVAECESGGLWSSDEGNGFYGGLQLDQETWDEYGGTEFAERPDLASRGQQIEIAEKILQDSGTGEWSECAENAGLSADSDETPDVTAPEDSGESLLPVPERPYPTDPSDDAQQDGGESGGSSDADGSGDDGSEGDYGSSPSEPAPSSPEEEPEGPDESDESGSADGSGEEGGSGGSDSPSYPDGSADDGSGGGDSSHQPSDPPGSDGGGSGSGGSGDGSSGGSGDSSDGRDDTDGHPSREGADGRPGAGSGGEEHRVAAGDSLSGIADEYGVRGGWPELYERNRDVVGSDPDLILPGQELRL